MTSIISLRRWHVDHILSGHFEESQISHIFEFQRCRLNSEHWWLMGYYTLWLRELDKELEPTKSNDFYKLLVQMDSNENHSLRSLNLDLISFFTRYIYTMTSHTHWANDGAVFKHAQHSYSSSSSSSSHHSFPILSFSSSSFLSSPISWSPRHCT